MNGPSLQERDDARRAEAEALEAPKRTALRFAFFSALVQAILKGAVGMLTGSLAVVALAVDSLGDFLNVAVGRAATGIGVRPPDSDHAFGHGKIEPLGALLQGVIVFPLAVYLVIQGIRRLRQPAVMEGELAAVAVLVVSVIVGYITARRLRRVSADTDSAALRGVGLAFAVDAVTHTGVIVAILLVRFGGWPAADPLASFAVALYVAVQSAGLVSGALQDLLDRQVSDAYRRRVIMELEEHRDEFIDYHRLRTRQAGPEKHIDLHLTICRYRTLEESHRLVDHLENAIETLIPRGHVIIHVDPCVSGDTCPGLETCEVAGERRGVMPETEWPAHPTGHRAREAERDQHPPETLQG